MPIDPTLPILAVFGSNHPSAAELASATLMGAAANAVHVVLLTGGDGTRPRTVKDAAIIAAEEASIAGSPARWIGVANSPDSGPPDWRGPTSVVVRPGWSDRRNFVSACMCDAAVVLGCSSLGSASEALFCLYLGRPLRVLGDPATDVTPAQLRMLAEQRIELPRNPVLAVDRGIAAAYAWATATDYRPTVWGHPPGPGTAEDIVATLLLEAGDAEGGDRAPRLDIDATVGAQSWDAYVAGCLPP